MDLVKIKHLPKILLPRKGKLCAVKRSSESLTEYESKLAADEFSKFDIYHKSSIDQSEVQLLLYRLCIEISRTELTAYYESLDTRPSKQEGTVSLKDFMALLIEILSNQSVYFRYIYNDKNMDINFYQSSIEDCKKVFSIYDENNSGLMNASELQTMLVEMGYYQLQKPIFEPYFAKPKKQLLNLDDFIMMHNSLIDIMHSNQ